MKIEDLENDGLTVVKVKKVNKTTVKVRFYHPTEGEFSRTISDHTSGPINELLQDAKARGL